MVTVTLAAVVLVRVVVIPKEMVPEEEEVLGDRAILLLAFSAFQIDHKDMLMLIERVAIDEQTNCYRLILRISKLVNSDKIRKSRWTSPKHLKVC